MKILLSTIICFLFCFSNAWAQSFIEGEVLIRFEENIQASDFIKKINTKQTELGKVAIKKVLSPTLNAYLLGFDKNKSNLEFAVDLFKNQSGILSAELNFIAEERDSIPNDSSYELQWTLDKMEIEEVWAVTTGGETEGGKEIVVAVIDSGFDISHEELSGAIWTNDEEIPGNGIDDLGSHGWNFKEDMIDYTFASSHGTSVAGIIGAKSNNETGMAGINWNIKMMLFQSSSYGDIVASYDYAYEKRKLYNDTNGAEGAFVVASNASLGFNSPCENFPLWNDVLTLSGEEGILNVGATVNADSNIDLTGDTPTSCSSDYIVTVTNTNIVDQKVGSAGYGLTTIDLGAPSGNSSSQGTYTIEPNNSYTNNFGGCSGASPHVAGTIALLYSLPCAEIEDMVINQPGEAALLMKQAILEGVVSIPTLEGKSVSGGRLSAYGSMIWMQIYCDNPTSETIDVQGYIDTYISEIGFLNTFPNPVDEEVTLEYSINEFGDFEVSVYDILGRRVYRSIETAKAFAPQKIQVATSDWAEGNYFVTITNGKKPISTKIQVVH